MWRERAPYISDSDINAKLDTEFANWFNDYVNDHRSNVDNVYIKHLAQWPLARVRMCTGFYVNGYKFQVEALGLSRGTQNWGVCVKGETVGVGSQDYYGKLKEIVQVEYPGWPIKQTVLFNCEWFDPTPNVGIRVHKDYNLIEINHRRRLNKYEPFILATQAEQVYYSTYPSLRTDKRDWWAVSKIKARSTIDMSDSSYSAHTLDSPAFQEDVIGTHAIEDDSLQPDPILNDLSGDLLQLDNVNDTSSNEDDDFDSKSSIESDEEPSNDSD